ncbi:MAG: Stp1/IreP family PP2C-type Ser/Thr phosphatase [Gemmatimonadetes bacterium]|nr:Stp1/IreP family PP2C-type Ser/Thr phosphatase [Gemmatimonadota bacterium]
MTLPDGPTPGSDSANDIIVNVFGRTDVGRTREHNEDAFVVADLTTDNATLQPEVRRHVLGHHGTMFMVADGMGGAAAGEIASAMATEVVLAEMRKRWISLPERSADGFAAAIKGATEAANQKIHQYALEHPEHRGMGTTATIAGILGDSLYVAQVGDSRAYLIRDGVARQITKDQSLIQKLVEAGELTPEEAEMSERRNIILQALGPEANIKVDLTVQQVRKGDTLVLCSDGLSGQVRTEQIAESVVAHTDLVQLCKKLIDLANEAGGPDNITVVAARFEGEGLEHAADGDAVGHRNYRFSGDARATMPLGAVEDPVTMTAEVPTPTVRVDSMAPTPVTGMPVISEEEANRPTPKSIPAMKKLPAEPAASEGGRGVMFWAAVAVVVALAVLAFTKLRQG